MIRSVDFVPRAEMERLTPASHIAVISINGWLAIPPQLIGFERVLRLEFEDVRTPGTRGAFSADHAGAVVAFVDALHSDAQPVDLVVHCKAGVSRSAAVARFIADDTGCSFAKRALAHGANPLVLDTLRALRGA